MYDSIISMQTIIRVYMQCFVLSHCNAHSGNACLAVDDTVGVAVGSFLGGVLLTAIIAGCVGMAVFWKVKKELNIAKQDRYICYCM